MLKPVIIQQSDELAIRCLQASLKENGLDTQDVFFVQTLLQAQEHLVADETQMLVFGSYGGIMRDIPAQVQALRDQYPWLVCLLYSVMEIPVHILMYFPIEVHIDKYEDLAAHQCQELTTAISRFRAGELRRDNARSYHRAPEDVKYKIEHQLYWT
jgi:hypothetical protein